MSSHNGINNQSNNESGVNSLLKSRQSVNPRINESSMKAKPLLSLFLAEFIGTTIFAYGVNASGLSEPPHMVLQIFYVSLSLSFSILLTANISGGHLNPAVSWAVCLTKPGSIQAKENIKTFAFYALSQISGAFFGGWVIYFIEDNINSPYPPITQDSFLIRCIFCEIFGAFLFILFIMIMTNEQTTLIKIPLFVVLSIGMFLAAAGNLYFYSGAVFNPAIGFGLQAFYALADHDPARLKYFYIYLICPFIGSTMTAFVYQYFYLQFFNSLQPAKVEIQIETD